MNNIINKFTNYRVKLEEHLWIINYTDGAPFHGR